MLKEVPLNALCGVSSFLSKRMGRLPVNDLNLETKGQNKASWAVSLPFFQFVRRKSGMQINAMSSEPGVGMFVSNHISSWDPFWAYYSVAEIAHRTPRAWAKKSLMHPDYKETAKADANRIHKDKLGGLFGKIMKSFVVAPYIRGFDPIPAVIGGQNREGLKLTREAFDNDQLVWMFIQGHRRPQGDLLSYLPGAAYVVLDRPNLPIYFVGFSGTDKGIFAPKVINFEGPVTLNQIRKEVPELAAMNKADQIERIGLYMVDRIAELVVDEKYKAAWTNGRYLMNQFGLQRERLLRSIPSDPDLSLTRKLFATEYPNHPHLSPVEFFEQIAA